MKSVRHWSRATGPVVAIIYTISLASCSSRGSKTTKPTSSASTSSTFDLRTSTSGNGTVPTSALVVPTSTAAGTASPTTQPAVTQGQTHPSGTTNCAAAQLQAVLLPSQGAGGGTIATNIAIRNSGPTCTIQGFPAVEFLNAAGGIMPSYVARSTESPAVVTLPANQPPVPTYGGPPYASFGLLGTNLTSSSQPCPPSRQEQPASLRVVLPGGASFTNGNVGSTPSVIFSSCDGRVQVSSIRAG